MTTARKNTLLASAIIAGVISLPMTWIHAANVDAELNTELPSGMAELFGGMLKGMEFDVSGTQGTIPILGGLPFWGAVAIAAIASIAQLLNGSSSFDVPSIALWLLAIVGSATISLPIVSGLFGTAEISPRLGWFVALYAGFVPVLVLALPPSNNIVTAKSGKGHPRG